MTVLQRRVIISPAMYGSKSSITSFNKNVGVGSSDDDLEGDDRIMRRTAARLTGANTSARVIAVHSTSGHRQRCSGVSNVAHFLHKILRETGSVQHCGTNHIVTRPSTSDNVRHGLFV